jgi:hypothetical protein
MDQNGSLAATTVALAARVGGRIGLRRREVSS